MAQKEGMRSKRSRWLFLGGMAGLALQVGLDEAEELRGGVLDDLERHAFSAMRSWRRIFFRSLPFGWNG